jgi:hypothetical protein
MSLVLKLGRKPAVHTRRTMLSALALDHSLNPLGTPPVVSDDYVAAVDAVTGGNWEMFANDKFGCCVEADEGHYLMLRTANSGTMVMPQTSDVLGLYTAETGFDPKQTDTNGNNPTDQGTEETSDCAYMVSTGFLGHKADATAMVAPETLDHMRWCIQLFGACKLGVNLPQSAIDQFNAGQPWTVVANDGGIKGGHDVPAVKYDGTMFYIVTWAKLQPVSPDWLSRYTDEAHALIFSDWIEQNGNAPSGWNLPELLAALPQVGSH